MMTGSQIQEKLKQFAGRRVIVAYDHPFQRDARRYHYVPRREDFDQDSFYELIESFDGYMIDNGRPLDFESVYMLSCEDGIEIDDEGEIEYVQVGDAYVFDFESEAVLHCEGGRCSTAFSNLDDYVTRLTLHNED